MNNGDNQTDIRSLKTAVQLLQERRREPRERILYDDPARIYLELGVFQKPRRVGRPDDSADDVFVEAEVVDLSSRGCSLLFRDPRVLLDEYSLCLVELPEHMSEDEPLRLAMLRWSIVPDQGEPEVINAGFEFL